MNTAMARRLERWRLRQMLLARPEPPDAEVWAIERAIDEHPATVGCDWVPVRGIEEELERCPQ